MPHLGAFARWLADHQYAPTSQRQYRLYVRLADEWLREHRGVRLPDATTEELAAWIATLKQTHGVRTQARKALNAFYKATSKGDNPAAAICRLPAPERLPRPLTGPQHAAWIQAAHELGGLHQVLGLLLATTGARFSELRFARWEDMLLEDPGWWRIVGKGACRKGPRVRQQPLHAKVVPLLLDWRDQHLTSEWVFPGPNGGPWCPWGLRERVVEIGEHAGLGRVTPHRLRHSLATALLNQTGNILLVKDALGHSSVRSTEIYTRLADGLVRAAVDGLPV